MSEGAAEMTDREKSVMASRIDDLVAKHGSLRAAGRVLRLDGAYLSRLRSGEKLAPSDAVLRRLGMKRIITYARTKP